MHSPIDGEERVTDHCRRVTAVLERDLATETTAGEHSCAESRSVMLLGGLDEVLYFDFEV